MKGGARGRVWGESPSARHLLFPYSRAGKQISYPDLVVPCSRLEKPPHLLATPSESPQSWEPRAGGRPPFQGHVPSSAGLAGLGGSQRTPGLSPDAGRGKKGHVSLPAPGSTNCSCHQSWECCVSLVKVVSETLSTPLTYRCPPCPRPAALD